VKVGDPLLLNLPTVQDGPLDAALAGAGGMNVVSSARTGRSIRRGGAGVAVDVQPGGGSGCRGTRG